jgi:hypothetical protein
MNVLKERTMPAKKRNKMSLTGHFVSSKTGPVLPSWAKFRTAFAQPGKMCFEIP